MYCHINSDDDQWQLVEILVLDILSIKLEYVSQNTLYHYIIKLLALINIFKSQIVMLKKMSLTENYNDLFIVNLFL